MIQGRWVNWGAPWVSSVSSRFASFIRVHPSGGMVHQGFLGSLGCVLGVVSFIRDRWVHFPGGRRVHPGSLGSLGYAVDCVLVVVGSIRVHWGAP